MVYGNMTCHNPFQPTGGPQMLQLSLDGRRLYVTNSLLSPWDRQFYGANFADQNGSQLIRVLIDTELGKLTIDPDFVVDFGQVWYMVYGVWCMALLYIVYVGVVVAAF
ncbi:hypothetical protein EON63_16305 [archaeon]|nr:MAG: hypothetical protein EON63_16305 [archaeon]